MNCKVIESQEGTYLLPADILAMFLLLLVTKKSAFIADNEV